MKLLNGSFSFSVVIVLVCALLECVLVTGFSWRSLDGVERGDANTHGRQKRQSADQNTIELMFYVDSSVYDKFYGYNNDPGLTAQLRRDRTLAEIRTFYTNLASGMNYRYSTLSTSNVRLQVKLMEVYIQETDNQLSSQTDASILLTLFTNYVKQQVNSGIFPSVDHYMLITSANLQYIGDTRSTGLANQDSMCGQESTSVVEDRFNFLNQVVFTHELAHSIGAAHDGANNLCRQADGFIMSSQSSITTSSVAENLWRFSSCSALDIENFINNLNGNNTNCMRPQSTTGTPGFLPQGSPLGQIYPPDEQCRRMFSSFSTLTKSLYAGSYEDICTGMWCSSTIPSNVLVLPADGTTCGNRKWCMNGECVSSSSAPRAEDTCPFGDQSGVVSSGNTCGQLVSGFLGQCYNEDVRATCCGSCLSGKLSLSGCEYGDRRNCAAVRALDCYSASVRGDCCKTCDDLVKPELPDNCRYGDKSGECTPDSCQADPFTCCETCKDDPRLRNTTGDGSTSTKLPDWVIPVAAIGGGGVIIGAIVLAVYCIANSRANKTVKKIERLSFHGEPARRQPQPQPVRTLQPLRVSLDRRQPPAGGVANGYRVSNGRYAQPMLVRREPNYAVAASRPTVLHAAPNGNINTKPMTYSDFMAMGTNNPHHNGSTVNVTSNGI